MIVAKAQVRITPDTTGFRPKVRSEVSQLKKPLKDIGADLGAAFSKELNKSLKVDKDAVKKLGQDIATQLNKSLSAKVDIDTAKFEALGAKAAKSFQTGFNAYMKGNTLASKGVKVDNSQFTALGQGAAGTFHNAFDKEMGKNAKASAASFNKEFTASLGGGVASSMKAAVADAENEVEAASSRVGRRTARGFTAGLGRINMSNYAKGAREAADAFTVFYAKSGAAYGAVSTLAGGLADAVGGLYLLGTAAASAAASSAALVGMFGAMLQGGIAVGIAFKGVFSSISEGFKASAESASQSSGMSVAAARRIADAQRRLAEVQVRNQERLRDALQRVALAQNKLQVALREEEAAQRALVAARRAAREEIEDMMFAAEDAALSQERAVLALEEAKSRLDAAQSLPVDSRSRREAELGFKEAELNYRISKDRVQDLGREQERIAKQGIKGTQAYQDAQKKVNDATNARLEAERSLAEAEEALATTRRKNAEDLADAQRDLARAYEDAARAARDGKSAADKYQESLNKLAPAAREFVTRMVALKDRFTELRKSVQGNFFKNFNDAFFQAANVLLPVFEKGLTRSSGLMATLGAQFASALARNKSALADTMSQNNRVLEIFTERTANGRSAMDNLVTVFLRLWQAIGPITRRFARFLRNLTSVAETATDTKAEMENLTKFFNRSGDRAASFGTIIGNIGRTFKTLAKAARPAIKDMLKLFENLTRQMSDSAKKNKGDIRQYFKDVVKNLKPMLEFVGKIALAFLKLGGNKDVGKTFETLQGAVPFIEQILSNGASLGPVLAELFTNIMRIFAALTNNEKGGASALHVIFNWFNLIAEKVAWLVETPVFQTLFAAVAPFLGAFKAASLTWMGIALVGKLLVGYALKFTGAFKLVKTIVVGIAKVLIGSIKLVGRLLLGAARGFGRVLGKARVPGAGKLSRAGSRSSTSGAASSKASSAADDGTATAKKSFRERREERKMSTGERLIRDAVVGVQTKITTASQQLQAAIRACCAAGGAAAGKGKATAAAAKSPTYTVTKSSNLPVGVKASSVSGIGYKTASVDKAAGKGTAGAAASKGAAKGGRAGSLLKGAGGALGRVGGKALGFLGGPLGLLLTFLPEIIGLVMKFYRNSKPLQKLIGKITDAFKDMGRIFKDTLKPVWDDFVAAMNPLIKKLNDDLEPILKDVTKTFKKDVAPVLKTIGQIVGVVLVAAFRFFVKFFVAQAKVLVFLFKKIWGAIAAGFRWIRRTWNKTLKPAFNDFKETVSRLWGNVKDYFTRIKDKISSVFKSIKTFWNKYVTPLVDSAKQIFEKIKETVAKKVEAIGTAFAKIKEKITSPIRAAIKWINEKLIANVNKLFNKLRIDLEIKPLDVKGFADGGYVSGPGGPRDDKIPARLSNGEYVMRAAAVNRHGRSFFDQLNNTNASGQGGLLDNINKFVSAPIRWGAEKIFDGLKTLFKPVAAATGPLIEPILNFFFDKIRDKVTARADERIEIIKERRAARSNAGTGAVYTGPKGAFTWPVRGWDGRRPTSYDYLRGAYHPHQGDPHPPSGPWGSSDWGAAYGTIIQSIGPGIVTLADPAHGWAQHYVEINHGKLLGRVLSTGYAHMTSLKVSTGQKVKAGTPLGNMGNPGGGVHLHFDMWPIPGNNRKSGVDNMDSWNWLLKLFKIKKFAAGGTVQATPGGILGLIGEGGRNERIEPLDSQGLSVRDRAIIEQLARQSGVGGGGSVVVKVFIGDRELRDIVDYQIQHDNETIARRTRAGRRKYR